MYKKYINIDIINRKLYPNTNMYIYDEYGLIW